MACRRLEDILQHPTRLLAAGEGTDGELLQRYARQRDEGAFGALVRRHGPLVLGVSRRLLHHHQDAEDVFQATFAILAHKAASPRWQDSIAGWLYRVAYRLALRTKARGVRQRRREVEAATAPQTKPATLEDHRELVAALDEELYRLSDAHREPLLLCYLEGKTRDQAARQLGWSLRTLERRLEQGLKLLRARLTRRGVELPVALLAAGLSQQAASADVSAATVAATVEAAVGFGTGAAVSPQVVALVEGGLKAMAGTKLKLGAALLLAASVVILGGGALGYRLLATEPVVEQQAAEERRPDAPPVLAWPEGTTVKGLVVDHRGAPVANAEVLLLGKERLYVDADRRTWFMPGGEKDQPSPPSTRTNAKGEFTLERKQGQADRLLVIAQDPLLWVVHRRSLPRATDVEVKLPPAGRLAIACDLPGKDPKQPVMIELRSFDGKDWNPDVLRFHSGSFALTNPGETVFEHLPPGQYAVERYQETPTGRSRLMTGTGRQLVTVEAGKRAALRIDRKNGRPLTGRVKGLENVELRYANVAIHYAGPEERFPPDGRRSRQYTAFDVLPIGSDGQFTTDPIPPGKYQLSLFAVLATTPEQSSQQSDFTGNLAFTVPEGGGLPKVEVVAKPRAAKDRRPNTDPRVRVVDETGKALPKFQAMLHTADAGHSGWADGRAGIIGFAEPFLLRDADAVDVLVRADGYAPAVVRFAGEERNKLRHGEATIALRRGEKVELRFRLPEGLTWPKGTLPEVYFSEFAERVRPQRQPVNRQRGIVADFNMLNVRASGADRFELQLAPDTPPFYVAIHEPGFLQYFDAGPFTLADARQGVLEVAVPRPATLDVRFDPSADAVPFKGVAIQVLRQIQGNSYLDVATDVAASARHELKLTDLAPGGYLVSVGTQPGPESKPLPGTEINPGAYRDQRKVVLEAGKAEHVDFRYAPFDPDAFRGKRTAVLRILLPDGTPAAGRNVTVEFQGSHYGALAVFAGRVPASGAVTLLGVTDQVPAFCSREIAYAVTVDGKRIGHFGFTKEAPTEEYEFRLAPGVGDPAPDVELRSVATGKPVRLNSLRGKVVCLEFWATWCGPCQPAMAKLNGLSAEQAAAWKGRVALVPVSIDTDLERVRGIL